MALENFISNVAHRDFGVNPDLTTDFPPPDAEAVILPPLVPVLKNVVKKGVKLLEAAVDKVRLLKPLKIEKAK